MALGRRALADPHGQGPGRHRHRGDRPLHRPAPAAVHRRRQADARPQLPPLPPRRPTTACRSTSWPRRPATSSSPSPIQLDVDYEQALGARAEAYERLIDDALEGDRRRFGRADSLDEQWRIVERVLGRPARDRPLPRGPAGPVEADALAADVGGWIAPL